MSRTELTDLVADAQKQWISSLQSAQELSVRSLELAADSTNLGPGANIHLHGGTAYLTPLKANTPINLSAAALLCTSGGNIHMCAGTSITQNPASVMNALGK